jgi:hypothetical protein
MTAAKNCRQADVFEPKRLRNSGLFRAVKVV